MATEHELKLKATLDTSDVTAKIKEIDSSGSDSFGNIEKAVKDLDSALKSAVKSLNDLNIENARRSIAPPNQDNLIRQPASSGGGASDQLMKAGSRYLSSQILDKLAAATKHLDSPLGRGISSTSSLASAGLKGATAGTVLGPKGVVAGAVIGALVQGFQSLVGETNTTANALSKLSDSAESVRAAFGVIASKVGISQRIKGVSNAYDEVNQLEAQRKQELKTIQQYEAALAAQKYDLTKVVAGVDVEVEKPNPVDIEVNEPKPVDIEVDVDAAGEQTLEDLKAAADKARESLSKIDFNIRESEAAATSKLNIRREELQKRIDEYEKYATGELDFGEMSEDERLKKYGTANLLANYKYTSAQSIKSWNPADQLRPSDQDVSGAAKDIEKSVEKSTYDNRKATLEALKEQAEAAQREIDAIDKAIQQRQKQVEAAKKETDASIKAAAANELAQRQAEQLAQKQAESIGKTASSKLEDLTSSVALEQLKRSTTEMTPQELQHQVQTLQRQRTKAMTEYGLQLKKAETTKSAADLDKAETLGKQFTNITDMLNVAQEALDNMSKIKADKDDNSSFGELMATATATSTLGQKGYDVGGYGQFNTVQQQALAQSVQQTQKISEQTVQTKEMSGVVSQIYNLLMRQLMQTGSLGGSASTWGQG